MSLFGNLMLWAALLASLVSLVAYVACARGNDGRRGVARAAFAASVAALAAASAVLMVAFLTGRYEFSYVAENSSNDLPTLYRVSAFWAGQAGSFLLWALLGGFIGLALIARGRRWEGPAMAFFTASQSFLVLLMLAKNPFELLPHQPADGYGLNPLLQDPWMAIHPPLIFLGYAALTVPFAFAVAALVRREYDRWVAAALPWTIFGWVTMGAGIFVGGYWAYRVLGWGGYWGWDPVENASLIPWLFSTALLHGMILQRTRGSMKQANILLATGSFVSVLYGTFLTRSGVLSNFSVHSFAEAGTVLYLMLLGGVLLSFFGPLVLFLMRMREVRSNPTYDAVASRDFAFFAGALVLCVSAAIVLVGTSMPLITSILSEKGMIQSPITLEASFYNRMHYPVALLLGILVGLAPLLAWSESPVGQLGRRVMPHLGTAAAGVVIALVVGARQPAMLLFIATSVFCLSTAAAALAAKLKDSPLTSGGPLSHVGLALMLIGIIGSGVYSRSEMVTLQPGEAAGGLGYRVELQSVERPNERNRVIHLTLSKGLPALPRFVPGPLVRLWGRATGTREFAATPRLVLPRDGSPMEEGADRRVKLPHVEKFLLEDVYVSPVDLREAGSGMPHDHNHAGLGGDQLDLKMGEPGKAGGYTFTFDKFEMSGEMGSGVGAIVTVKTPKGETQSITPAVKMEGEGLVPAEAVKVPGTPVSVTLMNIQVPMGGDGERRVLLSISGLPGSKPTAATAGKAAPTAPEQPKEMVIVDVSNKPLINLLWLGTVLVLAGGLVGVARRARESRKADAAEAAEAAAELSPAADNGRRRDEKRARRMARR